MRLFGMLTLLAVVAAPAADAASKVFYLDHAAAVGLPKLLDELILAKSPWVEELQPHWAELRAGVKVKADVIRLLEKHFKILSVACLVLP